MKNPVFLHLWKSAGDVWDSFKIPNIPGVKILFAVYTYEAYSGKAFVLFRQKRKLYEVNASHCSCYGVEDQWKPEETTVKALLFRLKSGALGRGSYSGEDFNIQLFEFLTCN